MTSRGKTLKLTAVSALVVLALTGFSTGRGHGGGSGDGDGGGCSSSGQNHDASGSGGGSHRDDDDDYDGGSGGSGGAGNPEASASPEDATVTLVDCASEETPYATVEVTNTDTVDGTFSVTVVFKDTAGDELVSRTEEVAVPAGGTTPARVPVDDAESVPLIDACDLDSFTPAS
ncbi:hypothetical protein ACF1FC_10645 [Streptomyces sp. NPDC014344]|uniref:hypothetical protein n=2 Tax=unclassified Streptomyces TaxID=2593676 RepID=UPI0036F4F75E